MPFLCCTDLLGQISAFALIDILHLAERIAHPFADNHIWIYFDKVPESLLSAGFREQVKACLQSDGVQAIPAASTCSGSDTHSERTDFYDLPAIALALGHWRRIAYRRGLWKIWWTGSCATLVGGVGIGATLSSGSATLMNCVTSSG